MSGDVNKLYAALDEERAQNLKLRVREQAIARQLSEVNVLLSELTEDLSEQAARTKASADYTVTCCEQALAEAQRAGTNWTAARLAHDAARATSQAAWLAVAYLRSVATLHRGTIRGPA